MPYVPDGLSKEEYAAIKARDSNRERNKDYGAWGPRWNRQPAPSWADAEFLTKRMGALARPTNPAQVQDAKLRPRLVAAGIRAAAVVTAGLLWLWNVLRLPAIVNIGARALNAPRRIFSQQARSSKF